MSFSFRFQRILDLREALERQAMISVSRALRERDQAAKTYEHWQQRQENVLDNLREIYVKAVVPTGEIHDERAHLKWVQERLQMALDDLHEAESTLQGAQRELQEASRGQKSLERLRDRHAREYELIQNRREQAFMDEIGSRLDRNASAVDSTSDTTLAPTTSGEESVRCGQKC